MYARFVALFGLWLGLYCLPVAAEETRSTGATPARSTAKRSQEFVQHYEAGMRHYAQKEYAAAVDRLQLAFQIEQKPRLLYNLARCHFELGHAEEALSLYQRFLRLEVNPPEDIRKRANEESMRAQEMIRAAEQFRPVEDPRPNKRDPPAGGNRLAKPTTSAGSVDGKPGATAVESVPIYKRWWFWTAIGGVTLVATVAGVAAGSAGSQPSIPSRSYSPGF